MVVSTCGYNRDTDNYFIYIMMNGNDSDRDGSDNGNDSDFYEIVVIPIEL